MRMSSSQAEILDVRLHDESVGVLTHLQGDRFLFTFDEGYINKFDRAVLSQQFIGNRGELETELKSTTVRAPAFFSNLLPEGVLRNYLAKLAGVNPARDFPLLELLGTDLPGAITLVAQSKITSSYGEEHGISDDDLLYRFSLAGVQLKFSAIANQQGGLTIPAQGIGGDAIVKLPSAHFSRVPENEYSMLYWAKKIGITTANASLVDVANIENLPAVADAYQGQQALLVERFDRSKTGKVHIEDFAQVYNLYPEQKYEKVSYDNMAGTILKVAGETVALDFIKRLIFSILIGNCDMHLKNWSLIYPNKITPVLAPAYDYVSTLAYIPEDKLALSIGGEKRFNKINKDKLSHFIKKAELPEQSAKVLIDEMLELTSQVWPEIKALGLLSKDYQIRLDQHLKQMLQQL